MSDRVTRKDVFVFVGVLLLAFVVLPLLLVGWTKLQERAMSAKRGTAVTTYVSDHPEAVDAFVAALAADKVTSFKPLASKPTYLWDGRQERDNIFSVTRSETVAFCDALKEAVAADDTLKAKLTFCELNVQLDNRQWLAANARDIHVVRDDIFLNFYKDAGPGVGKYYLEGQRKYRQDEFVFSIATDPDPNIVLRVVLSDTDY